MASDGSRVLLDSKKQPIPTISLVTDNMSRRTSLPDFPKAQQPLVAPKSPRSLLPTTNELTEPIGEAHSRSGSDRRSKALSRQGSGKDLERKGSHRSTLSSNESSVSPRESQRSKRGGHHDPEPDPREKRRRKIVIIIAVTAVALLVMSILLVAITLLLTPAIDEKIRQENERLLSLLTQPGSEPQGGVQESDNAFSSTSTNPSTETPGPVPVQADVHAGGEA